MVEGRGESIWPALRRVDRFCVYEDGDIGQLLLQDDLESDSLVRRITSPVAQEHALSHALIPLSPPIRSAELSPTLDRAAARARRPYGRDRRLTITQLD